MSDVQASARTTTQWVRLLVGAIVVAALCLVAARWQWARYELHQGQQDQFMSAYGADAVPAAQLLPDPGASLPADDEWRPVTAQGHYEPAKTVLLRNRPVGSSPVYHVLVPFVVSAPGTPKDGTVLVVDRGTVPLANTNALEPSSVPAPPTGDVTLHARLRPDEPVTSRTAPAGQVQAISTPMVLAAAPGGAAWAAGHTVGAYGVMSSESPAPRTAIDLIPQPDGAEDPGVNLSYTIQWCIFAAGLLGAYAVLWRRERGSKLTAGDLLAGYADADEARLARSAASAKEHRPTYEEEEDALLDAAGVDVRPTPPEPARDEPPQEARALSRPAGRYGA
jgi:cytochrome oxidase assembly protein ShyY1